MIGTVAPLPSTTTYTANLSETVYCEKYFSISKNEDAEALQNLYFRTDKSLAQRGHKIKLSRMALQKDEGYKI